MYLLRHPKLQSVLHGWWDSVYAAKGCIISTCDRAEEGEVGWGLPSI